MAVVGRTVGDRAWRLAIAWGIVAFAVHSIGNETGLYFQFGWYQNLTHAWSASALTGLVAVAGLKRGYRGYRFVAFVLLLVAAGALFWEGIEYLGLLDPFGIPLHFHDVNDMLVDMASNTVGVSLTLALVWLTTGWGTDPPLRLRDET